MQIQGLTAFLDNLTDGLILVSLSMIIGSVAWALVVLRASTVEHALLQPCLAWLRIGALALAATQTAKIIAKAGVVAASLGQLPWSEYAATAQFQASLARVVLALIIAVYAFAPLRARGGWLLLSALTAALLFCGAWLVHGASRLEGRAPLMMLTVLHQAGAGIWVGGVMQLLALWRGSQAAGPRSFWPVAVTRFSVLGMSAVALLLATGMALVALLSYVRGFAWARFWPFGFVALSVFLFFRSDGEIWPLGPVGFWQSLFGDTTVLQHRAATVLAFALGALETRSRTITRTRRGLPFLFPVLCAVGGILLVTHSHAPFEIKRDYLIQSTHLAMGLLALIMAVGRWLELRCADARLPLESKTAGIASIVAMLLIGLILVFYREPL